jgi:hypothetical protein
MENSFFSDEEHSIQDRRDVAFQTTNAIREAVSIARNSQTPTYEETFDLIHDLSPEIYDQVVKLLTAKNESEEVKLFKEKADAHSTEDRKVTAVELINAELSEIEGLLEKRPSAKHLKKRKFELLGAREYFSERKLSEHKILNHDFYLAEQDGFFKKELYKNESYKDYEISNGNILRIRLLHPDHAETILGADMIYEQFDLKKEKVRFVHLQYKAWEFGELYFSQGNILDQLQKMETHLCKSGYCHSVLKTIHSDQFRFPYCSGFLRPTDSKITGDSKNKTSGQHLPVCQALKISSKSKKLTKNHIKETSVSQRIFEEAFNSNLLGSNWINIDELEKFYDEKGIPSHLYTIRIHAQQVLIRSEEKQS